MTTCANSTYSPLPDDDDKESNSLLAVRDGEQASHAPARWSIFEIILVLVVLLNVVLAMFSAYLALMSLRAWFPEALNVASLPRPDQFVGLPGDPYGTYCEIASGTTDKSY
ncbi:hypothetical protein BKA93DRAFT_750618 [Sparassis latifolia]